MRRALRHTAALVLVGLLGAACAEVTPDQQALLDRTVESTERPAENLVRPVRRHRRRTREAARPGRLPPRRAGWRDPGVGRLLAVGRIGDRTIAVVLETTAVEAGPLVDEVVLPALSGVVVG